MRRSPLGKRFSTAAAAGLLLPLVLAVTRISWSSLTDWTTQVSMHWLLMAAPQIPFVLIGGSSKRLRPQMGTSLVALCILLLGYHAWVQWWAPQAERHLAQLYYATLVLPIALLMLFAQLAWQFTAGRRTPS